MNSFALLGTQNLNNASFARSRNVEYRGLRYCGRTHTANGCPSKWIIAAAAEPQYNAPTPPNAGEESVKDDANKEDANKLERPQRARPQQQSQQQGGPQQNRRQPSRSGGQYQGNGNYRDRPRGRDGGGQSGGGGGGQSSAGGQSGAGGQSSGGGRDQKDRPPRPGGGWRNNNSRNRPPAGQQNRPSGPQGNNTQNNANGGNPNPNSNNNNRPPSYGSRYGARKPGGYNGNRQNNFRTNSPPQPGAAAAKVGGAGGPPQGGQTNARGRKEIGKRDKGNESWASRAANRAKGQSKYSVIDIDSRRKARQNRKAEREEERRAQARQREDIFEVGPEGMSVQDLADMLAVTPVDIVKKLFMKGLALQVNSTLDPETVKLVGTEYGVDVLDKDEARVEDMARKDIIFLDEDDLEHLTLRPPVVTVMGHVDHGKTSLLDFVRKTKVAASEAGGITQSIGAYTCEVDYSGEKKQVTFLDTPGHEAFSAMRARGAKVTDIAIIIVAADDGVRPQTLEAVSHAKAAGVPIVVAINKVDKEGANPERVKQELTEVELIPEEWGGKTPMVAISAKKGTGVDELLETVLLVAELEELQANTDRSARGTVLEAILDKKAGPIATVLVQNGTLKVGDAISAGSSFGKVRCMRSTVGEVAEAGPSIAVQVMGLNSVPIAGDEFCVFESEARARQAAESVEDARRLQRLADMAGGGSVVTLSSLASMDDESEDHALQRMNIILKADASGSVEAVKAALGALPQDSVMLRYLMAAPGEVTVSDIDLATASGGMVLGFGIQPSEAVVAAAKQANVNLSFYSVIYDLVDDVRAAMEGRLRTQEEKVSIGSAEVKAVFGSGSRKVAGCMVTDGMLRKGAVVVVHRGKRSVFEGILTSLRRVKDDVKEVAAGTECGAGLEGFKEWEVGDVIQAYELVQKKLKLEEAHATTVV